MATECFVSRGAGVPEINGRYTASGVLQDGVPSYQNEHGAQLLRYALPRSTWWYLTLTPVGGSLASGELDCYRVQCGDDLPPCHLEWTTHQSCPAGRDPPPSLSKEQHEPTTQAVTN